MKTLINGINDTAFIKKEIETEEDIELMVDAFYNKVRADELLGDIFNNVIQDHWPQHLQKMYGFWQTVLLGGHTYFGSPFAPHARLPIEKKHFERWMELFIETVDEFFAGEKAFEAKWRAEKMAVMFLYKIESIAENGYKPIQ